MIYEKIPAVGLTLALGGALSGCGLEQEPRPEAVMSVNCESLPKDASAISLNEIGGKTGASEVIIDITDQEVRKSLTIKLVGRVAVDGHEVISTDAGKEILKLPTAVLIAGVPAPGKDVYYAGDEGLTLRCNDAIIADVRTNGN